LIALRSYIAVTVAMGLRKAPSFEGAFMDTGEQMTSVFEFLELDGESQITYYVVANVAN